MNQKTEKKRAFHMPHVFIILLLIMLFIVILSYVIPSGSYERIVDSATGITVIDPDTFQYVQNENPIRFMDYFEAVYNGFVNGATIMGTLFICLSLIHICAAYRKIGWVTKEIPFSAAFSRLSSEGSVTCSILT